MASNDQKTQLELEVKHNIDKAFESAEKVLEKIAQTISAVGAQVDQLVNKFNRLNSLSMGNSSNSMTAFGDSIKNSNSNMKELVKTIDKYVTLLRSTTNIDNMGISSIGLSNMNAMLNNELKRNQVTKSNLDIRSKELKIEQQLLSIQETRMRLERSSRGVDPEAARAAAAAKEQARAAREAERLANQRLKAEQRAAQETARIQERAAKEQQRRIREIDRAHEAAIKENLRRERAAAKEKERLQRETEAAQKKVWDFLSGKGADVSLLNTINRIKNVFYTIQSFRLGKVFVEAASDASEAQNVMDVVFKDNLEAARATQAEMKKMYKTSTTEYAQQVGTIGAMFQQLGVDSKNSLEAANSGFKAATDIASAFNMEINEALDKVRSGISGETEPLKRIGIDVAIEGMKKYAATMGLAWDELDRGTQSLLRLMKIQEALNASNISGDFLRTQDMYANSMRQVKALWEDVKIIIGNEVLGSLQDMLIQVKENREEIINMAHDFAKYFKSAFDSVTDIIKAIAANKDELLLLGKVLGGGIVLSKVVAMLAGFSTMVLGLGEAITSLGATLGGGSVLASVTSSLGAIASVLPYAAVIAAAAAAITHDAQNLRELLFGTTISRSVEKHLYGTLVNPSDLPQKNAYNLMTQDAQKAFDAINNVKDNQIKFQMQATQADQLVLQHAQEGLKAKEEAAKAAIAAAEKEKILKLAEENRIKAANQFIETAEKEINEMPKQIQYKKELYKYSELESAKEAEKELKKFMDRFISNTKVLGDPREIEAFKQLQKQYTQTRAEVERLTKQEEARKKALREQEALLKKQAEAAQAVKDNELLAEAYGEAGNKAKSLQYQIAGLNKQLDIINEEIKTNGKYTPDQVKQIKELSEVLAQRNKQLADEQKLIKELNKDQKSFLESLGQMGDLINSFGSLIGSDTLTALGGKFNTAGGFFDKLKNMAKTDNLFKKFFDDAGKFDLTKVFGDIGKDLSLGKILSGEIGIGELFDGLKEQFKNFSFSLKDLFDKDFSNILNSVGNIIGSSISQLLGTTNTKWGAAGGQLGSLLGTAVGGPIGGALGNIVGGALGNALGGGGRNRAKNAERMQKAREELASLTEAVQTLTNSMIKASENISSAVETLISNVGKLPTLARIQQGQNIFPLLEQAIRDQELSNVSVMAEFKKKSFWSGTKRSYKNYTITPEQLLEAVGMGDLLASVGSVEDLAVDQLKKFSEELSKVTNDDLERILNTMGIDPHRVNDSNIGAFKEQIDALIKSIEDLNKKSEQFAKDAWLTSFAGVALADAKQLTEQYKQMYTDMGLDPEKYMDEIQQMVDANHVLITAMQDVQQSFISAFKSGENAGSAFVKSMSSYFDKLATNIATVIYGTKFSDMNERLENIFKEITDAMSSGETVDIADRWGNDIAKALADALKISGTITDEMKGLKDKLIAAGIPQDVIDAILPTSSIDQLSKAVADGLKSGLKAALEANDISLAATSIGDAIRDHVTNALIESFVAAFITSGQFDQYIKEIDFSNMSFEEAFKALQDKIDELNKELAIGGMGNATTGAPGDTDVSSKVESELKGATITNNYKQFIIQNKDSFVTVDSILQLADKLEELGFERTPVDGI